MTERIDHAKTALDGLIELEAAFAPVKERNDIDIRIVANLNGNAMRELAIAQVHATLALVEQQRIANLIALHRHEVKHDIGSWSRLYDTESNPDAVLKPEIAEGLGIE